MGDNYESWLARYTVAMQTGRDDLGNDMFDLLYERLPNAEIWVHFDGSFWRADEVRAVEAALTG